MAKNFNAEPTEYMPVDADYTPITHKWVVQQVVHGTPTYYMFTVKMHKFYGKRMVMTSDIRSAHHFDTAEEAAEVYGYLTSHFDMPVHVVIVDE